MQALLGKVMANKVRSHFIRCVATKPPLMRGNYQSNHLNIVNNSSQETK